MLSQTTSQFSIPTEALDPITQLNFGVATELMQNHTVGMPVDPTQRVAAIRTPQDTPVIFSIGTDNGLYVIFTDSMSPSGWNQVDLRAAIHIAYPDIDAAARVYTMAVSQDHDGTFRIAVALAGQNAPVFLLTHDATLPATPSADFWSQSVQWVTRPGVDQVVPAAQLGNATPTNILLGTRDDGNGAPTMIAVLEVAQVAQRFFVNADFGNPSWSWTAYPLTQDIQHVDDVILGVIPIQTGGIRGTFVIGNNANNQRALYFTSLPTNVLSQTQNLNFLFANLPPNVAAIAALAGQIPNAPPRAYGTDLYIGGDGLYVLKAADMGYYGSKATYTTILPPDAAPGVQEIVGSLGGTAVSLWFTMSDAQDDLAVVRGTNAYADGSWTAPVTLFSDILQIAATRDSQGRVEDVILVGGGNQLRYLYQDQTTTLWNTHDITIQNTDTTIDFQCYQVHISAKNDAAEPFQQPDKLFSVSSSQWGYISVNDTLYLSSPDHPVQVAPNVHGVLTITQPVTAITTPIFHISAPFLTTGFDVHPAGVLNQQLNGMSADTLLGATNIFGGSGGDRGAQVLQGDYRNPSQVQSGTQALQSTTSLSTQGLASGAQPIQGQAGVYLNSIGKPVNQLDNAKLQEQNPGQPYAWGLAGDGEQWLFKTGQEALDIVKELGETVAWFFGDLFHHIDELKTNPLSFFVHLAEDTLKLVVKFEKIVVEVVLFTVEHALTALSWLLKTVFGIDISKLIQWLGFLFEFQYYQYTQQFIDTMLSGMLGQLEGGVEELKQFVVGLLNNAENYIRSLEPIQQDAANSSGTSAYNQYVKPVVDIGEFLFSNPVGSWVVRKFDQALASLLGTGSGADWETDLMVKLYNVWKDLLTAELENLLGTFSDLLNDLSKQVDGSLTMNQFIAQIGEDVLIHVIEGVKDLMIALFDVLEDVLDAIRNGFMNEGMDIPILSPLYHLFTGKDLRVPLFEILEWVVAIPATAITLFATGDYAFKAANPAGLSYTLDFELQPPAALPAPVAGGTTQQPTMAVARAAGEASDSGQTTDDDRATIPAGVSWTMAVIYSTAKTLDIAGALAVAGIQTKNKNNPAIGIIKAVQTVTKIFQICGGIPSIIMAEGDVKTIKYGILGCDLLRMLSNAMGWLAGASPPSEEKSPLRGGGDGGGDEQAEQVKYGAMLVEGGATLVALVLEVAAIGTEWGKNSTADDVLLVVQQAFEYGGDVVSQGAEIFEIKGMPLLFTSIGVGVAAGLGFGCNIARTVVDAKHHRNW